MSSYVFLCTDARFSTFLIFIYNLLFDVIHYLYCGTLFSHDAFTITPDPYLYDHSLVNRQCALPLICLFEHDLAITRAIAADHFWTDCLQ
jgi:hypothetical protein